MTSIHTRSGLGRELGSTTYLRIHGIQTLPGDNRELLKVVVGPRELESLTSCVSSRRSNQLSYGPFGRNFQYILHRWFEDRVDGRLRDWMIPRTRDAIDFQRA